jgi:hypothetical protein
VLAVLHEVANDPVPMAAIQKYFQFPKFDRAMIQTLKHLACNYLLEHKDKPFLEPFISYQMPLKMILQTTMKNKAMAGNHILSLVPNALKVNIKIYNFDATKAYYTNEYGSLRDEKQFTMKLHLLYRNESHYDMLIPAADMTSD